MHTNLLKLNDSKTEFVVMGMRQQLSLVGELSIKIGDDTTDAVKFVWNLGFFMDSEMKNGTHINKLKSSLYVILKNIARIRPLLDKETTKILVQTIVLSKMDYCNSLLLGTADYKINKLQKLQNMGCRIIFGLHKYDHLSDCMKDLHWLKIKQCIQYKTAVLTYKCINKTAPKYLQDLIMMQAPRPNMHSEANAKLPILCANTSQVRDSSFTMQAPHIWNALPGAIRKAATLDLFKKQLKTHLFREAYPQSASDNVKCLRNEF